MQQLRATARTADTFQLIWFHANGIDADLKYRQAFATFYGYVNLVPMYPHDGPPIEAFYFDYNAAFDMPDVEALILTDRESLQLCLNTRARLEAFRSTARYREFSVRDAVYDPLALEAAGRVILCRFGGSRRDELATARALEKQTGIQYTPIHMKRYVASAAGSPVMDRPLGPPVRAKSRAVELRPDHRQIQPDEGSPKLARENDSGGSPPDDRMRRIGIAGQAHKAAR